MYTPKIPFGKMVQRSVQPLRVGKEGTCQQAGDTPGTQAPGVRVLTSPTQMAEPSLASSLAALICQQRNQRKSRGKAKLQ